MSSKEEQSSSVSCPICLREFLISEIEVHADRCSFLKSDTVTNVMVSPASSCTKRPLDSRQQSPQMVKRVRNNPGISLGTKNTTLSPPVSQNSEKYVVKNESKASTSSTSSGGAIPLAEQMRPSDLSEYIGQEHVLGRNKVLRSLVEKRDIPSMILWGPPGCGKTTLAHIISTQCRNSGETRFIKLSATMSGVNEVKDVIKAAKNELTNFKRRTILFMDEIHRFNKSQQDTFLPHVESGVITLIGATTENPSFSLNSALLSRCRVIVFEKLETKQLASILERAVKAIDAQIVENGDTAVHNSTTTSDSNNYVKPKLLIEASSVQWLAEMCDGDARVALNSLQMALLSKEPDATTGVVLISLEDIRDGVKRSHLLYDKKGDQHYDIISAVHKSIRASDDNAALYWVTRMIQGGEDPRFIARRLVRAASEDIGLADPAALPLAVSVMQGCQLLGMPESDVLLAQCAVYLARAPKSREMDDALGRAKRCIDEHKGAQPGVPLHLRNAPTRLMKDLGYGTGYNMQHREQSDLQYMPQGLEHVDFFHD